MALAIALAALVGAAVGLLGGGGAVLGMPLYLYVLDLPARAALAATLVTVAATNGVAAITHARAGNVDGRVALWFGAAGATASFAGGRLSEHVPAPVLLAGFATLLVASAVRMLLAPPQLTPGTPSVARAVALGVAVGLLAGLVGAGGGFLVVPALIFAAGLSTRRAIGTSATITAVQAAAGAAGHLSHTPIDVATLAPIIGTACVASALAARLGRKLAVPALQIAFALLLFAIAATLAERELPTPWRHVGVAAVTAIAAAVAIVRRRSVND